MGAIDGKVCIVTGGAMGLGRADVEVLAREGGRILLTDVDASGEQAAAEIDGDVTFIRHDVRDEDQWRSVIATAMERFGSVDVLVNNAGVLRSDNIETATLEDWRFVNSVNVEGTFLGCKHAIPAMRAGRNGSIINMSSTVAIMGFPGSPAYTASKGAVQALTRSVAVYCIEKGDRIRCNGVYPHLHRSPMAEANNSPSTEASMSSPMAVANAVLFLASDASSDMNGTFINLDRGTSCIVGATPPGTL
jgi:3(or 17)beta-hydroxysteroid dehydrogenase